MTAPPDPDALHPIPGQPRIVLLRPLLARHPEVTNVEVGDFSYYDAEHGAEEFFRTNLLYNFGFSGARLRIGRYVAIAEGTRFVMPDANHATAGPSTYPFAMLGGSYAAALPMADYPFPPARNTAVGHDVWFGREVLVMPGVTIGHGAIVAARSVVAADVPDYAVVAGNPARVVRRRFDEATVARLLTLAWWDWPPEHVARAIPALVLGDADALARLAPG